MLSRKSLILPGQLPLESHRHEGDFGAKVSKFNRLMLLRSKKGVKRWIERASSEGKESESKLYEGSEQINIVRQQSDQQRIRLRKRLQKSQPDRMSLSCDKSVSSKSPYQQYKSEQRSNRFSHVNKISFLKSKQRSQLIGEGKQGVIKNKYRKVHIWNRMETETGRRATWGMDDEQICAKSREVYIKTSEGRRKKIDTSVYLQRIKSKLEQYSLPNFPAGPINTYPMVPFIRLYIHDHNIHNSLKINRKIACTERLEPRFRKKKQKQSYRPWSPTKQPVMAGDITKFCQDRVPTLWEERRTEF